MTRHAAQSGALQAHIETRRGRIRDAVERPLRAAPGTAEPLPLDRADFLLREAEELYWNELSWEQLTDEEVVSGGRLTELAFPGLLALVDGLMAQGAGPGRRSHPEVVEEILAFLAGQYLRFSAELEAGADSQRVVWARAMTSRLIDLVLYRLHQLSPDERERADGIG